VVPVVPVVVAPVVGAGLGVADPVGLAVTVVDDTDDDATADDGAGDVVVELGGTGATVGCPNSSTAAGATTRTPIPAASSCAATFSATFRSVGRSAAAPTTRRTGVPSTRQRPSTPRVHPADVRSRVAVAVSGYAGGPPGAVLA
jgi:hypothetical protein